MRACGIRRDLTGFTLRWYCDKALERASDPLREQQNERLQIVNHVVKFVGLGLLVGMLAGCGDAASESDVEATQQQLVLGNWQPKGATPATLTHSGQQVCRLFGPASGTPFWVPGKVWVGSGRSECSAQYGGGNPGTIHSEIYQVLVDVTNPQYSWQNSNGTIPSNAVQGGQISEFNTNPTCVCEALHSGVWTAGKLWMNGGTAMCSYEWGGVKQGQWANGNARSRFFLLRAAVIESNFGARRDLNLSRRCGVRPPKSPTIYLRSHQPCRQGFGSRCSSSCLSGRLWR